MSAPSTIKCGRSVCKSRTTDPKAAGWIAQLTELVPPTLDAFDHEGLVSALVPTPTQIGGNVVDAVGRDLAKFQDLEVVDARARDCLCGAAHGRCS
jgi:hypothetical protein